MVSQQDPKENEQQEHKTITDNITGKELHNIRNSLCFFLKTGKDVISLMRPGSSFQFVGTAIDKARVPNFRK